MQIELITKTDFNLLMAKLEAVHDLLIKSGTTGNTNGNIIGGNNHGGYDLELLLNVKDVAKKLRVSTKTVRSYIDAGKIKAVDLNRGTGLRAIWKIEPAEIQRFIKSRK